MPSTTNKGLEIQTTGSNSGTWGQVLNDSMISYVDVMLGGITALSLSATNVALTQAQARNALLRLTGTLTAGVSISPDTGVLMTGFYYFENLTSGAFQVTFVNSISGVVLPQGRRGVCWVDATNGIRIMGLAGSSTADPIPTGTNMVFFQSAAPSGWTQYTSLNEYNMRVVSGTGGGTSGSVSYSTLFGRLNTDNYTLTTNDIPSHAHSFTYTATAATGSATPVPTTFASSGLSNSVTTAATGGGNGHSHNIDMRVLTANVIMATRN